MTIRLGFCYEQQRPGLYLYDDETGLVLVSEDTNENNFEIAQKYSGAVVLPLSESGQQSRQQ